MEKPDSALCLWIVLYTNYFNFQFSYLYTFYKPNNIKTKPSIKVKTYSNLAQLGTDEGFSLDPHGPKLSYHCFKILGWI